MKSKHLDFFSNKLVKIWIYREKIRTFAASFLTLKTKAIRNAFFAA